MVGQHLVRDSPCKVTNIVRGNDVIFKSMKREYFER